MNVIMDASSIINLHNGGVIETICSMASMNFQIGPIAGGECSEDCAISLANLKDLGLLEYLEDTPIDSDNFLEFVALHKLGDGESECIMLADMSAASVVCCDDLRGRRKTEALLGADRLIGSLGLLKQSVICGLISAEKAFEVYELMKAAGGFLPEIEPNYFTPT